MCLRLMSFAVLLGYAGTVVASDEAATLSLELSKVFTFFFLTLGPKAVIAPFARSTAAMEAGPRRRVALVATGISLLSVLIAATIGVRVLNGWGISTGALLIAAGIILFLVALESIQDRYDPPDQAAQAPPPERPVHQVAYQMAFPYIVSPYGVAVVILVLTTRPASVSVVPIIAMLAGIMVLNGFAMLTAHRIARSAYLAPTMAVVGSVLAVLQAALGIQAVLSGLKLAGVT